MCCSSVSNKDFSRHVQKSRWARPAGGGAIGGRGYNDWHAGCSWYWSLPCLPSHGTWQQNPPTAPREGYTPPQMRSRLLTTYNVTFVKVIWYLFCNIPCRISIVGILQGHNSRSYHPNVKITQNLVHCVLFFISALQVCYEWWCRFLAMYAKFSFVDVYVSALCWQLVTMTTCSVCYCPCILSRYKLLYDEQMQSKCFTAETKKCNAKAKTVPMLLRAIFMCRRNDIWVYFQVKIVQIIGQLCNEIIANKTCRRVCIVLVRNITRKLSVSRVGGSRLQQERSASLKLSCGSQHVMMKWWDQPRWQVSVIINSSTNTLEHWVIGVVVPVFTVPWIC